MGMRYRGCLKTSEAQFLENSDELGLGSSGLSISDSFASLCASSISQNTRKFLLLCGEVHTPASLVCQGQVPLDFEVAQVGPIQGKLLLDCPHVRPAGLAPSLSLPQG